MAKSALRFDRALIERLPSPLAHAIAQLDAGVGSPHQSALITLWQVCDAVEVIVRLLVCMVIAELHAQRRIDSVAQELGQAIDRPTLGQWRRLLGKLAERLTPDTMLLELKQQRDAGWPVEQFFSGDPKRVDARDDPLQSFLALRNRLAHGAGLTHGSAADLLMNWDARVAQFMRQSMWMSELTLIGAGADARAYRLRGLVPEPLDDDGTGAAASGAWMRVERGGRVLHVWPLICYGVPQLSSGNVTRPALQLYSRRSAIETLQYTPIASDAFWSFGDKVATKVLDDMLLREQLAAATRQAVGAAASFGDELARDSKLMIGREKERRVVVDAMQRQRGRLLWLDGEPGSGKSTLMASLATELREQFNEDRAAGRPVPVLLPFRFKVGDYRCTAPWFLQLMEEGLDPAARSRDQSACSPTTFLNAMRARLAGGQDCLVVLDGLDEIEALDPTFIPDVFFRLVNELHCDRLDATWGRVTWLCAGRKKLTPRMKKGGAVVVFDDGLPGMEDFDIRAMLLDRIGRARERLLKDDRIVNTELDTIPVSQAIIDELDRGRVPHDILRICKITPPVPGSDGSLPSRPRALPVLPGVRWVIDDDDDHEMYFVEHQRRKKTLRVHADRAESEFVTRIRVNSQGLPIYVRCVINDILAGGETSGFQTSKLPLTLELFFQRLVESSGIGDVQSILTPVVCLIAVARESISDEQLILRVRDFQTYRDLEEAAHDVATALVLVSPMLKSALSRTAVAGYTIYHKAFRDHLLRNPGVKTSIFTARQWLCRKCRDAVDHGLETLGPMADYLAHHGVDHLLEFDGDAPDAGSLALALQLYTLIIEPQTMRLHGLRPMTLMTMAKRIADAINHLVDEMREADEARRASARVRAQALPEAGLAVLMDAVYETGTRNGAIRVLAELHPETWNFWRRKIETPYDMVLRHDIGEVMADLFEDAEGAVREQRFEQLVAMVDDARLEEREVAGYALQQLFLKEPDRIDVDVLARWANAEINIERMILGELMLGLANELPAVAVRVEAALPPSRFPAFWHPLWPYLQTDLDTYRVLLTERALRPALKERVDEPGLAACARETEQLEAERAALIERASVRKCPAIVGALEPEGFAELGHDESPIEGKGAAFAEIKALLEGVDRTAGLDVLKALMCHPMWNVAEAAASALERLIELDGEYMSLIEELLDDRSAHWRVCYATIDASFNVGARDDYALFVRAIKRHGRHPHSRVTGICGDDVLAWLRLGDDGQRDQALGDPDLVGVLRDWVATAADCWLLEYVYLIARLLHRDLARDVEPLLADGITPFLQGDKPFYECERDEVLLRIEANLASRADRPTV